MRVLMTGHRGYLGSVMAARFAEAGHQVTGLDTDFFAGCDFSAPAAPAPPSLTKDLRDVEAADLEGFEAVVHLGALSNDPLGNLNPAWTHEINHAATVRLAERARQAGVERFLLSSSCIMYGESEALEVDETTPLAPRTAYAQSKALAERDVSALAGSGFSPVFLRNGTVYGLSPRMRFDTVLNNLTGAAVANGVIAVEGDGAPWRPVVHIEDVCSVFLAALAAPRHRLHNEAINAATGAANHQVRTLAEIVAATVPGCRIEYLGRREADRRTYKANFDKIARLLPEFQPCWTVERGAAQLCEYFRAQGLDRARYEDARFTRLKWLGRLLAAGSVGEGLRWAPGREVAA